MWEVGCRRLEGSVHAVLRQYQEDGRRRYETQGTAFAINIRRDAQLLFLTNAHVVSTPNGERIPDADLALVLHAPSSSVAGAAIRNYDADLDIAVLVASVDALTAKAVTFAGTSLLPRGTPVAAIGCALPLPSIPSETGGGNLLSQLRLATGYVSVGDQSDQAAGSSSIFAELPQYELNMLSYPGLSGSPVFDVEGRVVGINRGTLVFNQQVAAYAYARRNQEVLAKLDEWGVPYHRAGSARLEPRRRR